MNLPMQFDEQEIEHYHALVSDLEKATGESLFEFAVPNEELKLRVTGSPPAPLDRLFPRSIQYSRKRYCSTEYAKRKIEALFLYLTELANEQKVPPSESKDYWSMSDPQLERLAKKYSIPAWGRSGLEGEKWFVNRTYIIDELVKRDNALRAATALPLVNVLHVGEMHGSVVQQGSPGATAQSRNADFASSVARSAVPPGVGATPARSESAKSPIIYFLLGSVCSILPWGASLIGITVNLYLGAAVLLLSFCLIGYAFWLWERPSRWHVALRIGTVILGGVIYAWLIGRQMLVQHRRELPGATKQASPPNPQPSPPSAAESSPVSPQPAVNTQISGSATTSGRNSPAVTGNGNSIKYSESPLAVKKPKPK